jgi:hypothetical protein
MMMHQMRLRASTLEPNADREATSLRSSPSSPSLPKSTHRSHHFPSSPRSCEVSVAKQFKFTNIPAGICRSDRAQIFLPLHLMPAQHSSLPPAKKRKVVTDKNNDLERIQRLEKLLLQAVAEKTSLNPLVDLLDVAKNAGDPHHLFKCIYALYRVFVSTIDARMLVPTPDPSAKLVRIWIFERLDFFTDMLVGLMSDSEEHLRVSVFNICLP